ncbi:PREDICTED: uncharacterized protein LOC109227703 [Nicotiana attenuata]|uniref:uncharacterized protein LOC109227703 n=1 Tax=Nicotiana attenuata TaxID=49451 RepID=UPI000904F897|nr:PREDICTED: uncharacterized protein LOC109227703 [Nicotiana attenuata]
MPTFTLPADAVARLLNVLEELVPTQDGLPARQATSHTQAQVVQPVANTGKSKDLKNFMNLKPPKFDSTQAFIDPQKFIVRGSAESWWNSVQRGRRARLPPITWSECSTMFMGRFISLSKRENMRCQFEQLRQRTSTVTEYEAKFTELSTYAHFLVADEYEKGKIFVDGLEHRYRGPVVRDVRGGSDEEVVDTALRFESYQKRDMTERESKRARSTGRFSGVPSRGKKGFNCAQSRLTQSESLVQSSGNTFLVKQGQQQMQGKDNVSFKFGQYLRCNTFGRNHYGRHFGIASSCCTCREKGHIAKYCPKGNSGTN